MKNLIVCVTLVLSLFALNALAGEWKGTISDAKCGMAHVNASEKDMKCVSACVKGGQAPVFVTDGKVLKIDEGSKAKVMDHLGHKVTITGRLNGDTLSIDSVSAQ